MEKNLSTRDKKQISRIIVLLTLKGGLMWAWAHAGDGQSVTNNRNSGRSDLAAARR